MEYKNAKDILPQEIVDMLQDYYQGGYLYIPKKIENNKKVQTDYKIELEKRNQHIFLKYLEGWSKGQLISLYHLSESSIRRIVLEQKKRFQEMPNLISDIIPMWGIRCSSLIQIYPSVWEVNSSYVIKVYNNKYQLERNIKISGVLSEYGIPVAEVIPTKENKQYVEFGKQYYLMTKKLPGSNLTNICDLEMAYQIGKVIGKLHFALKNCEERAGFSSKSLLEEVKGYVRSNLEKDEWAIINQDEYIKVTEDLEKLYEYLPKQLIHRDVHLGNFLFYNNKFTGYIDFDLSQRNVKVFDICYFLAGLLTEEERLRLQDSDWFQIVKKVLEGYESVNELLYVEKEAIPCVMKSIEMLFAAYFISIKDFRCAKDAADVFHYIEKNELEIRNVVYD